MANEKNIIPVNEQFSSDFTVEEATKLQKLGYEFVVEDGVVTYVIQN